MLGRVRFRREPSDDPEDLFMKLMYAIGWNVGTLQEEGLWTPELQELMDAHEAALRSTDVGAGKERAYWESVAKFASAVEAALDEHGIEYSSVLDLL